MDQTKVSFDIKHPGMGILVTVRLDGAIVWQGTGVFSGPIEFMVADDKDDHVLEIEMAGKTWQHTQVDPAGSIIMDHMVEISAVNFDAINVDKIVWDLAEYEHDANGTRAKATDRFFGSMGCNGTVRLRFITPVYLWLLENM